MPDCGPLIFAALAKQLRPAAASNRVLLAAASSPSPTSSPQQLASPSDPWQAASALRDAGLIRAVLQETAMAAAAAGLRGFNPYALVAEPARLEAAVAGLLRVLSLQAALRDPAALLEAGLLAQVRNHRAHHDPPPRPLQTVPLSASRCRTVSCRAGCFQRRTLPFLRRSPLTSCPHLCPAAAPAGLPGGPAQ
jgi:hypothetical protein